jgi:site-specific DNA-methyltransferase (adenine-specific)
MKEHKTTVINYRVTESAEQQLAAYSTGPKDSVDKAARRLMLEALQSKEQEQRAKAFGVDKLEGYELFQGDALRILPRLPAKSFHACLTSPPYWKQRNYDNHPDQLGQEPTPERYINRLADIFDEVHRLLKDNGTLWLNIDDTYWRKQLCGIPWLLALEMKRRGWFWRSEIVWAKASTPEPVKDRPTRAHEALLLFSKRRNYVYNYHQMLEPHDNPWAIDCIQKALEQGVNGRPRNNPFDKEGRRLNGRRGITRAEYGAMMNANGKNRRDVWHINSEKFKGAHSAVMPLPLAELVIRASTKPGDIVLDPFAGVSTSGVAALRLHRRFVGAELLAKNVNTSHERLACVPCGTEKKSPLAAA